MSAAYHKDQGPARAVAALRNVIAAAVNELAADGFWSELAGNRGKKTPRDADSARHQAVNDRK